MTAKVILNPYSNRWNSKTRWPQAEAALKAAGIDFSLVISEHPRQIIELTKQAVLEGFSPIIAAGGDGTIGEVVNGMAQAARLEEDQLGPMGVIPLGTANDMVCNLGLPLDLEAAVWIIAAGQTRSMDVCRVNDKYFVNNSAIGLEPYVTLIQQRIKWISGITRYLLAAVRGIMAGPKWVAKVEWDGGQYEGPISLLTVGNSPRTGGFYMTPHANAFDGKLTFVYGFGATKRRLFVLLPAAMKPEAGNYVEAPEIHEQEATWIKIHLENPSPAHVDGEIFDLNILDLEFGIQPGRLSILMPREG